MSTLGLPMDVLFKTLDDQGFIIDWIDFCNDALKDGWNLKTLLNKLDVSIFDSYGKDYRDNILEILKIIFKDS